MDGLGAHLARGEVVDEWCVVLVLGHVIEPAREAVPPILQVSLSTELRGRRQFARLQIQGSGYNNNRVLVCVHESYISGAACE